MRAPRILVLYWHPKGIEMLLAVRQHLRVLEGRGAQIVYRNAIDPAPPRLGWIQPDLCLLHTTFLCVRWNYDFEEYRCRFRWVARLDCPKIALPQDEYDHAGVLDEWLLELGVTSVYSCFGPEQRTRLYPLLGHHASFHETLTGFIDEEAAATLSGRIVPHSQRRSDIVYRAKKLPYWFGSHGQLKHRIAGVVRQRAGDYGLRTDISTRPEDTIYGADWLDFLMSGRAVIGSESGSSVLDVRGEVQRRISRLLAEQPDLSFEEVDARMPSGWDSYAFFAISPRHLEAVITKTAQVLVEGRYSGVLEPERHYIPLRRDFSNLDEALERLRDVETAEAMAERAYRDVYLSGLNNRGTLADRLYAEARVSHRAKVALPVALARRPSLAVGSPIEGKPLRQLVAHFATLGGALARQRETRALFVAAIRGRVSVPLKEVAREVIVLRILARIRRGAEPPDDPWSLSIENNAGQIVIRTHPGGGGNRELRLDGPIERVVWNHAAVAQFVPVYPRHPRRGWISLGLYGRYEFNALAEVAQTDPAAARALLARVVEEERSGAGPETTGRYDPQPTTKAKGSEANDQ
jgi:hypothetical protein